MTNDAVMPILQNIQANLAALDRKLDDKVTMLDDKVTALDRKLDDKVTMLDDKVTALDRKLDDKVTTLDDKITALDRKVSAQGRDLVVVMQDVRMIRATIHDMVDTRVTEGEVAVLHEDVNRVQIRLRDLEVRVEGLEAHRPE